MAQNRNFEVLYPGFSGTNREDIRLTDPDIVTPNAVGVTQLVAGEWLVQAAAGTWGRPVAGAVDEIARCVWLDSGQPDVQTFVAVGAAQVPSLLLQPGNVIITDIATTNPDPAVAATTWARGDEVTIGLIAVAGFGQNAEPNAGRAGFHCYDAGGADEEVGRRVGQVLEVLADGTGGGTLRLRVQLIAGL